MTLECVGAVQMAIRVHGMAGRNVLGCHRPKHMIRRRVVWNELVPSKNLKYMP